MYMYSKLPFLCCNMIHCQNIIELYKAVMVSLDGRGLDNLSGDERSLAGSSEDQGEDPLRCPCLPARCCLAGTVGLADVGFILLSV